MRHLRWAKRYPETARIAAGLLKKGYTIPQVQTWLVNEGHLISKSAIGLLCETPEQRRARLDRKKEQNRRNRELQRASGQTISRGFRKNSSPMLNTWLENPDCNPKT